MHLLYHPAGLAGSGVCGRVGAGGGNGSKNPPVKAGKCNRLIGVEPPYASLKAYAPYIIVWGPPMLQGGYRSGRVIGVTLLYHRLHKMQKMEKWARIFVGEV